MKNILIGLLCIIYGQSILAQDIHNVKNIKGGGLLSDHANAITTDKEGNIYVAGSFQGTALFGDKQIQAIGDTDIFIAKYDPDGNVVWLKQEGGANIKANTISEYATDIFLREGRCIYVTGVFSGYSSFGDRGYNSNGQDDFFIARLGLDGSYSWVRTFGGVMQDKANTVTVDQNDNIYVGGYFQGNIDIDGEKFVSMNNKDGFVLKLSENGKVDWFKQYKSTGKSEVKDVAIDKDRIVALGEFNGKLFTGSLTLSSTVKKDLFLEHVTPEGRTKLARNFGSSDKINAHRLVLNEENIYATGSFTGGMSLRENVIFSSGLEDAYLAKFDVNLNPVWLEQIGGTGRDQGRAISFADNGNIIVAGSASDHINFSANIRESSDGRTDGFVAAYSADGNHIWHQLFSSVYQDRVMDIATTTESVYIAGVGRWNENASNGHDVDINIAQLRLESIAKMPVGATVYPNPASSLVHIQGNFDYDLPLVANVYDVLGNKLDMVQATSTGSSFKVDVSQYSAGVYVFVVTNGSSTYEMRLLVER